MRNKLTILLLLIGCSLFGQNLKNIKIDSVLYFTDRNTGDTIHKIFVTGINTFLSVATYIDFDSGQVGLANKNGRLYYDSEKDNLVFYNSSDSSEMDITREGRLKGINTYGSTIPNGSTVIISGDQSGVRTLGAANAKYDSTSIGTIGFATETIAAGDTGEVAIWGEVNDLNTSGETSGMTVYLDTVDFGWRTSILPSPNWIVYLGNIGEVDASTGSINSRVDLRTNTQDVLKIFNGAILEDHTILIVYHAGTAYLKITSTKSQISLFFDGLPYRFNVPDSVALTAGSDVSPTRNWIYIPESTKALTKSTSSYPSDEQFIPIVDILIQSEASAETYGAYKVHAWTDHLSDATGQGHLSHVNKWIRNQNATWLSGVSPTVSVGANAAAKDTIKWSSTSGQVLQLHSHAYPYIDLQNGGHAHVFNDQTTPYTIINSLGEITTTTTGASLESNNTYYSLIVWGSVSEDSVDCQLFVNKPTGFYSSSADAIADASNYAVYTIPSEYRGTGFLIAKINIRYQTADNGTFTISSTQDLRGLYPSSGAGGGTVSSSGSFADNAFEVYNVTDNTKKVDFDVSGVTTGTERTLTIPNKNGTIAVLEDIDSNFIKSTIDTVINDVYMPKFQGNVKIGDSAAWKTSGYYNTAIGELALKDNTSGVDNTAIGRYSLQSMTSGNNNISIGSNLSTITTGYNNIGIGFDVFSYINQGRGNIGIGYYTGRYLNGESNYRLIINSLDRDNALGDTTKSIIYGVQDTTTIDQQLYFNANVKVKHNHSVNLITSGNDSIHIDSTSLVDGDSLYMIGSVDSNLVITSAYLYRTSVGGTNYTESTDTVAYILTESDGENIAIGSIPGESFTDTKKISYTPLSTNHSDGVHYWLNIPTGWLTGGNREFVFYFKYEILP